MPIAHPLEPQRRSQVAPSPDAGAPTTNGGAKVIEDGTPPIGRRADVELPTPERNMDKQSGVPVAGDKPA